MMTFMKRVDPEEGMDRWYMVFVQASLFDPAAVICAWGSRRTAYHQLRVLPAGSTDEALATAKKIVQQKVKRGYLAVTETNYGGLESADERA
jgi:predicted DNA-binding WGR domain protein